MCRLRSAPLVKLGVEPVDAPQELGEVGIVKSPTVHPLAQGPRCANERLGRGAHQLRELARQIGGLLYGNGADARKHVLEECNAPPVAVRGYPSADGEIAGVIPRCQ